MTLGDIIAEYRKSTGISMERFAELSGMSKAYISILERNKTPRGDEPSPSFEKYRDVAKAVGLDVDELIRRVDGKVSLTSSSTPAVKNILPMPKTYKVPLVGTIACGQPILAAEESDEAVDVPEWIDADFALKCKGDSMINARIFDGDIVYIRKQPEVESGQIAAVRIDDEATLKKVYYAPDAGRIILRACNPLFSDMVYEGDVLNQIEILGLAVGFYSNVRHGQ